MARSGSSHCGETHDSRGQTSSPRAMAQTGLNLAYDQDDNCQLAGKIMQYLHGHAFSDDNFVSVSHEHV